jgi:hypothetical protein
MPTAFQLPTDSAPTERLGRRLFRKKLLPLASIDYNGRRIDFTKEYLQGLVDSFRDGAYDDCPFVLADDQNRHTMDPSRVRGSVKGLELSEDGLSALVEVTDEGAKVLADNGNRLGVSARIVEDLSRADGKTYKAALAHVLGTTDPRINNLGPWQELELSNSPGIAVVDLTQSPYERTALVPEFTDDEMTALRAILATKTPPAPVAPVGVITPPAPPSAPVETDLDPELEAAIAEILAAQTATEPAGGAAPMAEVALSAETVRALELAQANENQRAIELSAIRSELDAERFRRESAELASAGVPPKLIELSRPLLEGSNRVIDLSNGTKVDAGVVIRAVLEELKGTIDLSGEFGGRQIGATTTPDEPQAAKDMVAAFKAMYGRSK